MLFDQGRKRGKSPRKPQIVAVEKGEILSRGNFATVVAGRTRPGVFLTEEGWLTSKLRDDGRQILGGTVVHDDHFEIAKVLPQNRVQCLPQQIGAIVCRNDDREEWFRRHLRPSLSCGTGASFGLRFPPSET